MTTYSPVDRSGPSSTSPYTESTSSGAGPLGGLSVAPELNLRPTDSGRAGKTDFTQ